MWAAGWRADLLDAPGKLLLSDPEHPHPRRARAYLLTDRDVKRCTTRNAENRPTVDVPHGGESDGPPAESAGASRRADPARLLWQALTDAPEEGASITGLIEATGKGRTWVYDRLHELAGAGQATPTARRGRWRAVHHPTTGHET
jgi:S-DNA-T family DNA segregation ATPase FtsK/SpoIIIE